MLQAYALQNTLNKMGAQAKIIDLRPPRSKTSWNYRNPKDVVRKLFYSLHERELLEGYKKFEEFIDFFDKTERYNDFWCLKQKPPLADVYISGSDQVWNPLKIDEASFLRFAPDDKVKATYAASLGISYMPQGAKNLIREYLESFDYISLREKQGKELIEELTEKQISVNIDPTLLLKKEDWEKIAKPIKIKKPYILCYILYRPKWLNKWLKKLARKTKKQIILVSSDAFRNVYSNKIIRFAGPREFLGLIKEADFVISSSFHGVALSIANKKPFYAVVNPNMPSRISNLLDTLNLNDRIVKNEDFCDLEDVNYDSVEEKLNVEREKSFNYLKNLIENPIKAQKNTFKEAELFGDVSIVKEKCTACSVCENVCPTGAIKLVRNQEGFCYPEIDKASCVNCGLCLRKCHAVKYKKNTKETCKAYYGYINDEKIRLDSSSGGIFTAVANKTLESGGVVFGAYFDADEKKIKHASSDQVDIEKFRKSKYAESSMEGVIVSIEKALKENRRVLFTGTPCQCSGVRERFGKAENLIIMDFLCHGVPSIKVFQDYLEQEERKRGKKIIDYKFRTKDFGWSNYGVNVRYKNGKTIKSVLRCNWFYQASMTRDLFLRKSCYTCSKNVCHDADLTIGDFWGIANYKPEINDQKGISVILTNTPKGEEILDEIRETSTIYPLEKKYIEYGLQVKTADKRIKTRDWHYEEYFKLGAKKYSKKYFGRRVKLAKLAFRLKKGKFKKAVKK